MHVKTAKPIGVRSQFLLPLMLLASVSANAASLRSETMVRQESIRLSDLFDDAGANGSRVLGPAPAPGNRVVVEAAQLSAIARQYGVDWRAVSSADRVVLDRPGRPVDREDVLDAIHDALSAAGASPDIEIELAGFVPPMVPIGAISQAVATQMDYDSVSGRFSSLLSITAIGMEPVNLRIVGRAYETREVPVAVARLAAGTVLTAQDVRMSKVRRGLFRGEAVPLPAQLTGLALRRAIGAGQPFLLGDLGRPATIQKGAMVQIKLDFPGLTVTAQGQALEPGAVGDRIRVLNPVSHASIVAQVMGPDLVRVSPDAPPIQIAGQAVARGQATAQPASIPVPSPFAPPALLAVR